MEIKNRKSSLLKIGILCLVISILSSCAQDSDFPQAKAQSYLKRSEAYYAAALTKYKDLITKGKDLDRLYLELGQLYYGHGDFEKAIETLKNTSQPPAKKLLAISHYRLGNFTDALEIFNKHQLLDDEYLYYQGLTCESLNLFDQAIEIYKKVKEPALGQKASSRIERIEKQTSLGVIQEISPQTHKILQTSPFQEEYPQAGALILYCDERIEINSEYTQVSSLHYIIKILNERGKEGFSEVHLDYDSTYEKVELEYARTISPDGKVTEVGSRHIRDVSKYLNFPLYSNVRVFIISFPEITKGASIEYKLKVYRNQLINKKDFVLAYPVQSSEPIILANLSVSIPKEKRLHIITKNEKYNNFNAELLPEITERGEHLIYNWNFKNIPQIIPESSMPAEVEINPTVFLSTFSDWQQVYDWWWALSRDKIKASNEIQDKVLELIKDKDSDEAKIRAIYNFCAQDIRYVAVEYGQAGYEPHKAEDVFKNRYGDCKDQAILLVTMLKEAGFLASPVLIGTKNYYDLITDFPTLLFNHCITAVWLEERWVFLDPTALTCAFGDLPVETQGRGVLVFQEDGYKIQDTVLFPAEHNLLKQNLNLKIAKDETITAQKVIFTFGHYDQLQRGWLLYTPPELVAETLKEKIQQISIGASLDKFTIDNLNNLNKPIVLSYDFKGQEYFTTAGSLRIMPQLASLETSLVAKDKRKYAIDFGVLDSKESVVRIELPADFAIKYLPDSLSQDSPWLKFGVEYNVESGRIYFRQKTELKKNIISEEDYLDFKDFFENLAKQIKQRIVLEKIN